jgi:hypothetical protein
MMSTAHAILASVIALFPLAVSAKGETTRIVIAGDGLSSPIDITERSIVEAFSIWNGPGVRVNGWQLTENTSDAFIDWLRGAIVTRPLNMRRFEASLYVGSHDRYVVAYEVDLQERHGYVYLPQWKNDLITHDVEGNWFFATKPWDDVMIPLIIRHTSPEPGPHGSLDCTIGTGVLNPDGIIELNLVDDDGKRAGLFRYAPTMVQYSSVRAFLPSMVPGEKVSVSCWPSRE